MTLALALGSFDAHAEDATSLLRLPCPLRQTALERHEGPRRNAFIASRLLLLATCSGHFPDLDGAAVLTAPPGRFGLWWSLSHTDGLTACLWSTEGPCGVDVEREGREADALAIARRYFDDGEYRWLAGLPPGERQEAFLELWTRKEACLKAMETGIAHHLPDTVFVPGRMGPVRLPPDYRGPPVNCHAWRGPGWQLAAAWRGEQPVPVPDLSAL